MVNGKQKGCKKILVLYTNFGKNRKPEKTNWVMHQYHLGQHEEEKEGELVVSKIFYQTQPRQCNWSDRASTTINAATSSCEGTTVNSSDPIINPMTIITRRDSGGGGSCSSSREIIVHRDHHELSAAISTSYSAMDIHHQQLKSDQFSFLPYRKSFEEVSTEYFIHHFLEFKQTLAIPASSLF